MSDETVEDERTESGDGLIDDWSGLELAGDGSGQTNDGGQQQLEGVLRALVNQRCRYTLYFLQDYEVSDLEELATYVAAMERNTGPDAVDSEQFEHVRTSLVHSHLPSLADQGLVEFDRRSEAVRYSRPPDLLEKLLRVCAHFDAPKG